MSDDKITLISLPSGLRLAHRLSRRAQVEYCGVTVRVGSRDDNPNVFGMAHFVEHTIFKGTTRRTSWHIINRMERVGGELNAYTSKEETVIYTAAPTGNLKRALQLIADLIINSRFPAAEIDKEREVIADEINSYLDSPSDAVFDDFEDMIFAGTPLGHNILGNVDSVMGINSDMCRQYLHNWYSADNMVVFYQGPVGIDRVSQCVETLFADLPVHTCRHQPMPESFAPTPFDVIRNIDSHQAHTVMGCLIPDMYNDLRFAYALTNNILGGPGMNSLLNIALREKRGLVYSVETAASMLSDTGLFTVYFGCDHHDTAKCRSLVTDTINRLADHGLTPSALAAAKKQYIGQTTVASDNRENTAIAIGRAALYYNNVLSRSRSIERINAITNDDIRHVASTLTDTSILTLC